MIRCGNHGKLKTYHETTADVRTCFGYKDLPASEGTLAVLKDTLNAENPSTMANRRSAVMITHNFAQSVIGARNIKRSWSRTINGVEYRFKIITMLDLNETRLIATKYNGYMDDGTEFGRTTGKRFSCAWDQVHFIILKGFPAHVAG